MRLFLALYLCALSLCVLCAPMTLDAQKVLAERRHDLTHQGVTVLERRALDAERGTITRSALTTTGQSVDVDALAAREEWLRTVAGGKLSPDLRARLAELDPAAPLEIALWLALSEAPDFRAVLEAGLVAGDAPEDARRRARDAAERYFGPHTRGLATHLEAAGYQVTHVGACWPLVLVRAPAAQVASIAADPRVAVAYHAAAAWFSENQYAQPTLRSPTVHARGIDGSGSTLKVMVNDPGHVTTLNPYLPPITLLNSGSAASHATSVAGNICGRDTTNFGVARALPVLYSGNGSGDSGAPTVWNLAIKAGVSYGNCSWWNGKKGKIEFLDRFFDYTIRTFGVMMFKSNGNQGTSSTPYATTPGNGYNMTCTGCYNDGNSADWSNDRMASYSSYWNPAEGHEKPEVATPGDSVTTTYYRSPWIRAGFGGTSSASPLTCGVAALLGTRDTNLRARTQTLKAVLMASAWHNVEGAAVLSDKDGAGGVHAAAADAVLRDQQYADGILTAGSFDVNGHRDLLIPVLAGDETRVVALWFSNANSQYSTDRLDMDLDIVVLDPASQPVAASASTTNPFEIVAFVPVTSGNYTVRLVRQRFQGSSEPFAVVWSSRADTATTEVKPAGTFAIGTTVGVTFRDGYHPGATYVGAASFGTLPQSIAIHGGHVVPLGLDPLLLASIQGVFPGFLGSLDAAGEAVGALPIPNLGALRGLDIYLAMITLGPAPSVAVIGLSPAATFRIQ